MGLSGKQFPYNTASSSLAATVDHKGVLRGRCTLCSCLGYREAKDSNKCGKCSCPSSVHVSELRVNSKLSSFDNWSNHATFRIFLAIVFLKDIKFLSL